MNLNIGEGLKKIWYIVVVIYFLAVTIWYWGFEFYQTMDENIFKFILYTIKEFFDFGFSNFFDRLGALLMSLLIFFLLALGPPLVITLIMGYVLEGFKKKK